MQSGAIQSDAMRHIRSNPDYANQVELQELAPLGGVVAPRRHLAV